ncbi:hypothetical protein [Mycoplasma buteonis]|uniref:hypothetical protein n=1 Tax=Mycoplasma buteonis TaxID=171280 RepID=UPI000567D158|nr:hypothetical protein [Mycoplasma buteonis]
MINEKIRIAFNQTTGLKIFFNIVLLLIFLMFAILLTQSAIETKLDLGFFVVFDVISFIFLIYFTLKSICLIFLRCCPFSLGKKFITFYSILEFKNINKK